MSTIVKNPTLTGFSSPPEQIRDRSGNIGYIEHPTGWTFVYDAKADVTGDLPQSLHRDRGYCIAAGWRRWLAGYQQSIELKAGKRYLAKVVFMVRIDQPTKVIEWHFLISKPGDSTSLSEQIHSEWSQNVGGYGREDEHLFVFQARQDMTVDLRFEARSVWPDNECDFNIYLITVEEVAGDYGGDDVHYIGSSLPPAPAPVPTPTPVPTPPQPPTGTWRDQLDERQRKEVEFASLYAKDFGHGTDGHNRLLLIAKLATLLDEGPGLG